MDVTFEIARCAARLCRADRRQRQHADPGQGGPPRIPPRRRRRVQLACRSSARQTASTRSASSRRTSRSSRADGTAPDRDHPRSQCRGTGDRPASAVGRLLEPRELHLPGLDPAAQLPRQGPDDRLPASTIRAIRKSVELSFTEPYVFDKQHLGWASTSIRRDYNSFNYLDNDRNTTYQQSTTGIQLRARRAADRIYVAASCATPSTTTT